MKLRLTPENLRAAYGYLVETGPFCHWNMPAPEDIKFRVSKSAGTYGVCWTDGVIECSSQKIASTMYLMQTMAHEMVHLYIQHHKIKDTSDHGRAFKRLAQQVCETHGFDPKAF